MGNWFKKIKIKRYKKRKINEQKSLIDNKYLIRFKVKIEDKESSQIFDEEFDIMVPAKAAFFAKRKVEMHIKNRVGVDFIGVDKLTEEEYREYERIREKYKSETSE